MKKLLLVIATPLAIIYGRIILVNNSLVLFYGDTIEEVVPFYQHLRYLLLENPITFWDQSNFLGASIYSYFFTAPLGSIFLYISFFFNEKLVPYIFPYFDIIRFFLVGIFSYLWLSTINKKKETILIGSTILTFSGFMMNRIHYSIHIDAFLWVPLLLYSVELLLQRNKKGYLFIFSFFMIAFLSIYYAYMATWFIIIYLTFRIAIISIQNNESFWILYKNNFIRFIKYYLLAFGLAAVFLIPEIYIVLSSPRLEYQGTNAFLPLSKWQEYYSWFTSFLSPVINNFDSNLFIMRANGDLILFFQFTTILFPIAIILLILKHSKVGKAYLIYFIFMQSLRFFPITSFIFNGNDGNRWLFFLVLSNIIVLTYVLDELVEYTKKQIIFSSISVILILLVSFIFSRQLMLDNYLDSMLQLHLITAITFILGYCFYLISSKKQSMIFILVLLLIGESTYILYARFYTGRNAKYVDSNSYENYQLAQDDDDFYHTLMNSQDYSNIRIDVEGALSNHTLRYDYSGFTFYSSIHNSTMQNFLNNRFTNIWNTTYKSSRQLIKNLLGTRYYIPTTYSEPIPYGFIYDQTLNGKDVYINPNAIELGFATSKTISLLEAEKLSPSLQDILMYQYIIDKNSINYYIDMIEPIYLGANIENKILEIPQSPGYLWIDYSKNSSYAQCEFTSYDEQDVLHTFTIIEDFSVYLKNDLIGNNVDIYCTDFFHSEITVPFDAYFLSNEMIDKLNKQVRQFDQFFDIEDKKNGYTAKINITDNNSTVFTNIPYDKGWKVYVNGEEIDKKIVNLGFLGFDLTKGIYNIEFKYSVYLMKESFLVSLAFLAIILLAFKKKWLS